MATRIAAVWLLLMAGAASAQTPQVSLPPGALSVPVADTAPTGSLHLGAVIRDSLMLLAVEHGVRIVGQEKTRRELGGPFWADYRRSVRVPDSWEDGDNWFVNYVGHPMHGAAAGLLWSAHDPVVRQAEFGLNTRYWKTRWRPLVWSAIYSVQFEVGPISEASIGNVGLRPNTIGWVDYVVTPIGGMGIAAAEDALDKYFIRWFEGKVRNRVFRASMRMLFNPSRTMANTALRRVPWHRDGRALAH